MQVLNLNGSNASEIYMTKAYLITEGFNMIHHLALNNRQSHPHASAPPNVFILDKEHGTTSDSGFMRS